MSPGTLDTSTELARAFDRVVASALEEDLAGGGIEADDTTRAIVPPYLLGRAVVRAKARGVICGLQGLAATFRRLDGRVAVVCAVRDGDEVEAGGELARLEGPVAAILAGERTALNLLGHLSGVATLTRAFVRAAPRVEISDTRKTLPGLRLLQKYAVRTGGGVNHRFGLWDGILVKDNHIVAAGGVGEAVRRARARTSLPVQVECTTAGEVEEALEAGAVAFLLDNRDPSELATLVRRIREQRDFALVEASGGITLETVAAYAACGVDRISVGALTHSAAALDVSLTLEEVDR